jgi:ABC-2 type transport system ATP-binding protein
LDILLEASEISRRYGDFEALKPTSFNLIPGDLVVLTGPNGAGKSTLLLCLSGLLGPTTGTIEVDGHDLYGDEPAARRALAAVLDVPLFYHELTAWEHLSFVAMAHGAEQDFSERAASLLHDFGLWEARDLFPHAFSRGMRLKLGLVLALIRPFRVLLLDEPSSALDQEGLDILASRLEQLRSQGNAVLLSTHDAQLIARLNANTWEMKDGQLNFRTS